MTFLFHFMLLSPLPPHTHTHTHTYAVFFHRNSFIIAANPFCSPLAQNEVVGNFVVHLPFSISHFAKSEVSEAQQQQHPKCWPLPNRQADVAVIILVRTAAAAAATSSGQGN